MAQAFRDFHHQSATLRIVDAKANLSMAARQRRPKVRNSIWLGLTG